MGSKAEAVEWKEGPARSAETEAPPTRFGPDFLDLYVRPLQAGATLLVLLLIGFAASLFGDGDTGWHLGAGRWILEHRSVPLTDPFSHTFAGAPWTAHEWLAEVLMVGAHQGGGWHGLALLFALAAAATTWLIAREAFRYLPARYALAAIALLAAMMATFLHARPHVLAWPLLAGWTIILLRARDRNEAPPIAAALLMVIWANLHASYIIGFGLAGLLGLESLIANSRDKRLFGRWLLFGVASLVAAMVTPLGPAHVLYPFQVSGMEALSLIGEWRPSHPKTDVFFYVCLAALVVLAVRRWRTASPLRLLLLAGLATMAVLHIRHQMLFGIVGLLVVLPMMKLMPARGPAPPAWWLLPVVALVAAARLIIPQAPPESAHYPLSLLAKVPPEIRAQPVYNEYSQGGPLVMLGIRPYIDGRADMYGDAFTLRATRISRGNIALFREDVARYGIRWVVLQKANGLVKKLDKEPGWRRLVANDKAVIFVASR